MKSDVTKEINQLIDLANQVDTLSKSLEKNGYSVDWIRTARNTLKFEAEYLKSL